MRKLVVCLTIALGFCLKVDACDISDIDKYELVRALFEDARPQGMGYLQQSNDRLSDFDILQIEAKGWYVDYVHGRSMKIDISGPTFDTWLYNRDNGSNRAEEIVKKLRNK